MLNCSFISNFTCNLDLMASKLETWVNSCSAARHYLDCTLVKMASKSVLMD